MKAGSFNENPIPNSGRFHTCNVCGSISVWTDQHGYIERLVGKGYQAWEESFIICSNECRSHEKAKPAFIKWLSAWESWTKKTATENYESTIENK